MDVAQVRAKVLADATGANGIRKILGEESGVVMPELKGGSRGGYGF
jgi:hypothetical protein